MLKFKERKEEGVFGNIIVLENGIELYPNEWNGEVYTVKDGDSERVFKPVQEPISFDEDGEPDQWEIIGYEESSEVTTGYVTTAMKELLKKISDLCYKASDEVFEDEKLEATGILTDCDHLQEKIDRYLGEANPEKKKYYSVTTSMTFKKTVLVPADSVKDIDEAMDLVDRGVEIGFVELLNGEADCETKPSPYTDENGIYELTADEVDLYQILEGDLEEKI